MFVKPMNRFDRLRPGGNSSIRKIQVTIERQGQRTGMGVAVMTSICGGIPDLAPHFSPLRHAEAVLLVDDPHPQLVK